MQIKFNRKFVKAYDKASQKIKQAFKLRLALFRQDPFSPPLNNHALKGKYSGTRSISITGDWRALYELESKTDYIVSFVAFGTHSQLYR